PMGVIAIIYESRPNVTADAAVLCIKSGNVCILRGGKEAVNTNAAIAECLCNVLEKAGFTRDLINFVDDTTREGANEIMRARGYVDLLIPRGGAGLIRACVENALVPCIETGTGICHIYVDKSADINMAVNIAVNAKASRPSVCNAAEVCLVHKDIAESFLPLLAVAMAEKHVELRLCLRSAKIIEGKIAELHDFDTEFLDYILSVCIVDDINDAIEHIAAHSTGHSEAIITESKSAAKKFCKEVDSAAVYVNASTRFTDGGEFGFGCEMGISTQKLGARGPMGLYELTSYKYIISGNGQTR
ncbi:MAG: glutamate-5-semialdehyde dehydrogenase, partial [Oscillospiraceae bacterium]